MSYLRGAEKKYFWKPEYEEYAKESYKKAKLKKFDELNSIRYAADKFIGYCSHEAIPDERRINIKIINLVGLTQGHENGDTTHSDVMSKSMKPYWKMSLDEYINFKKHPSYKWWEKS